MWIENEAPTITEQSEPVKGQRHSHPAFGQISVVKTNISGDGIELFGSKLKHRSALRITISTAHLDRHLNRDWIHNEKDLLTIQMSESQWASFITSQAGVSVPVTFESRSPDDAPVTVVPGIESVENMRETFDREIRERLEKYMELADELHAALQQAASSGKASKGTLVELQKMAHKLSAGMPDSMGFVQKQMAEAMDKTATAAKTEVEAFVFDLAARTGLETLRNQAPLMLESKGKGNEPIEG